MNNIFKNAYFGKPYKTRGEKKALYWCHDGHRHKLITKDDNPFQPWCDDNGLDYGWNKGEGSSPFDIVSEWQEEINEEKVEELAKEWWQTAKYQSGLGYGDAFKAGCRKIIEIIKTIDEEEVDKLANKYVNYSDYNNDTEEYHRFSWVEKDAFKAGCRLILELINNNK